MQPASPFYPRYAPAPMLSHPAPVPASLPHQTSQLSHTYPSTSSAPSYVYASQYTSPYPPHPSVAYSPYVTHSPHAPFLPSAHPVPSVHLQPPAVLTASPALYGPAAQPRGAPTPQTYAPPSPETCERQAFYRKLHAFRDAMGEPIQRLPTLGFKELDLWVLYKEVVKRRGIDAVIAKKQWKEVAEALQLPSSCTDSGFRLRLHYKKYLEAFERKYYDPPEPVTPRSGSGSGGKDTGASSGGSKAKMEVKSTGSKKVDGKMAVVEKGSSSVTSSGSAATEAGDTENESAGTVSNGSGSRRSSVSRAEATSKGEGVSRARTSGGIVKKKKRSGGNGMVLMMKKEMKEKNEGKGKKSKEESEEERRGSETGKQCEVLGKQESVVDVEMESERQGKQTENEAGGEGSRSRKTDRKGGIVDKLCVKGEEKKNSAAARSWASGGFGEPRGGISKASSKGRRGGVDFSILESATLKRYARVHGVAGVGSCGGGKKALAERVGAHFSATPLRGGETATLLRFIQAVRRR